jgi:hypothetical protein
MMEGTENYVFNSSFSGHSLLPLLLSLFSLFFTNYT